MGGDGGKRVDIVVFAAVRLDNGYRFIATDLKLDDLDGPAVANEGFTAIVVTRDVNEVAANEG